MVEKNILNDLELNHFIKIINELCGMDLNDKKNTLLLKLPNFLEELNFKKMADLLIKMRTNKDIRQKTLNFVTITETYFLRELSQLQEIIYYIKSLEKRVSVLSAPCASGEEVYSLAILATKHFVKDIEILGIDINSNAIEKAKKSDKPIVIIANTIKGKGVSFMENNPSWHGKAPNDEQLKQALEELK